MKIYKVYKITNENFKNQIYIGTTSLTLKRRLSLHKTNKRTSACAIIDGNEKIELITTAKSKEHAEDIETHTMNQHKGKKGVHLLNVKGAGTVRRCGGVQKYKNECLFCTACSKTYTRTNKSNHFKTQQHKKNEENQKNQEKVIVYFN